MLVRRPAARNAGPVPGLPRTESGTYRHRRAAHGRPIQSCRPGQKKKKTALFPRGPVQNSRSGAGMDGDVSENLEGDDARKRGDAGGLEPIQLLGRLFRSLILVFTSQDAAVVGVVAWWPRPAACPRETRRRPCLRAARALNLLVYLLHCSSRHGAWRQEMNCSCRSAVCCRCEHEYGWILSAE